jgi:hypothetical protein
MQRALQIAQMKLQQQQKQPFLDELQQKQLQQQQQREHVAPPLPPFRQRKTASLHPSFQLTNMEQDVPHVSKLLQTESITTAASAAESHSFVEPEPTAVFSTSVQPLLMNSDNDPV